MPTTIDKTAAKAKEVAIEDFNLARGMAERAVKSGAWLYPVKGIFYFLSHRSLWKPLIEKLLPTMTLSIAVVSFMFIFTYLPQLAIFVFTSGPVAVFSTILLVLSESSTIITILSKNFLIQDALVDVFDAVLVARNQTSMLSTGREIKPGNSGDPMAKLGKMIRSPFEKFSPKAIIRYVMYLPLNFIPLVGTVVFVFLQGKTRGEGVHSRYFQLKKWSNSQREAWLKENTAPYTAFGTIATLLELVPVASILFSFTNTVGAALWASDIEANDQSMTTMQAASGSQSSEATETSAKKTE